MTNTASLVPRARCAEPGCDNPRAWAAMAAGRFCIDHYAQTFPANPNAGRLICPTCRTADWTMPFGDLAPGVWRCVACHRNLQPEPHPSSTLEEAQR